MNQLQQDRGIKASNVLFIIASLQQSAGGTALEIVNLASSLAEMNDTSVMILTQDDSGPHLEVPKSIKLFKLKHANPFTLYNNIYYYKKIISSASIIFITGIWGFFDGLMFRCLRPKRIHYYIRICGMLEDYILRRNPHKKIIAKLAYVNNNLNNADGLIVNSTPEKNHVKFLNYKSKVLVIRNWVKPPEQHVERSIVRSDLNFSESDRVILYLGRIHPKKNLDKLLEALINTNYSSNVLSPKLLIAGRFSDPAYEKRINSLINQARKTIEVNYFGEVVGIQKEILFSAADVFILPSSSEGLPNAVLEAMIRGIPVAITNGCNLPEIVLHQAGILFDPTSKSIEEALSWIMSPQTDLSNAGIYARRFALEYFSKSGMINEYKALLYSGKVYH